MTRLAERAATRLGWTEGQVQTALIGTGLSLALTVLGLAPALGDRPATAAVQEVPPAPALPAPLAAALPAPSPSAASSAEPPSAPESSSTAPPPPPEALTPVAGLAAEPPRETDGPPPPAARTPRPTASPAPPSAAASSLSIASSAWFGEGNGGVLTLSTPVPDGGLPVAARGTRTSRLSTVRLTGNRSALTLRLPLIQEGQQLGDRSGVLLCPLLDGSWKPGPAQPLDRAPLMDSGSCVIGERGTTTWSFDLSTFAVRIGGAGFALSPVSDPARQLFQVTFEDGSRTRGSRSHSASAPAQRFGERRELPGMPRRWLEDGRSRPSRGDLGQGSRTKLLTEPRAPTGT